MDADASSGPPPADVVLLVQALSAAFGDRVMAEVRRVAGPAVRVNDGYVFQHLVPGPQSVTALAEALGVTQQAASKQVHDLEARGLVERRDDPNDRRSRLVALSARGRRAVEAARVARATLAAEAVELLGPRRARALERALVDLSDHTGALDHLAARRLRPESER